MVVARIGGKLTKLILDTGSTDHVFTTELTNDVGLVTRPAPDGTDHAGAPVPSWTLGNVSVEIDGTELRLRDAQAIKGPAAFAASGIGGFLSPQNLHPSASVVIDMIANRLVLVDGKDVSAWLRTRYPTLHPLLLKRARAATVLVEAAIEPFGSVATMLNTGGRETEFARAAVPTLRGAPPESVGLGVSGTKVMGEVVNNQALRVGDVRLAVPALLVRDGMKPPLGLVGMDVLRGTVLVVGANPREPVRWLVPATVERSPR